MTAPRPRVEGEAAIAWLKSLTLIPEDTGVRPDAMGCVTPSEYRARAEQLVDNLAAYNAALTAEVERLRGFAERMISPCEWGPSAFVEGEEYEIFDAATSNGILVERVHDQPCEIEGCECDGSPTLLYFAWSPEAAALALPTTAPEATDG